jgi:tetratricopeptide (TPR) repeat protein
MVKAARGRRVPVVLFELPVNIKDCPPCAQQVPLNDESFFRARMANEAGEYRKALAELSRMKKDPRYAGNPQVNFYLGKTFEGLQRYAEARREYETAVNLNSVNGFRTPVERNAVVAGIAKEYDCPLVNIEQLFSVLVPHGLLGNQIFADHCHWFQSYNAVIIPELLRQIYAYNTTHVDGILVSTPAWHQPLPEARLQAIEHEAALQRGTQYYDTFINMGVTAAFEHYLEVSAWYFSRANGSNPGLFADTGQRAGEIQAQFARSVYVRHELDDKFSTEWYYVLCCIGETYRRAGAYNAALRYFDLSIRANSRQNEAYVLRGLAHYDMGDYRNARLDWELVIARDDSYRWLQRYFKSS